MQFGKEVKVVTQSDKGRNQDKNNKYNAHNDAYGKVNLPQEFIRQPMFGEESYSNSAYLSVLMNISRMKGIHRHITPKTTQIITTA